MGQNESGRPDVLEILRERAENGNGDDGAKVALVLEGGGMRGAISAEMTAALVERGILDLVDVVVGTSAGAVNAVGAAAGVVGDVAATYSDVFANPRFESPYRVLRAKPLVDTSAIVAEMERRVAFASKAYAARRVEFGVISTDVDDARGITLDSFTDEQDLYRSIQASATLPLTGGRPVIHRGRRMLDGGIAEAIPVEAAKRYGATHAIVLVTRPQGSLPTLGTADKVVARYLDRLNPAVGKLYRERPVRYAAIRQAVEAGSYEGMSTVLLGPTPSDTVPSRTESDPEVLRAVRADARATASEAIDAWSLVTADR